MAPRSGQLPVGIMGPVQQMPGTVDLGFLVPIPGFPMAGTQTRGRTSDKPLPRDVAIHAHDVLAAGVGYPSTPPTPNLLWRLQALAFDFIRRDGWRTDRVTGYNQNPTPLPSMNGMLVQNSAFYPYSRGSNVTLSFTERLTPLAAYAYHETMTWLGIWQKAGVVGVVLPGGQVITPRPEIRRVFQPDVPNNMPAIYGQ